MSGALAQVASFPVAAEWDAMRNAAAIISRSGIVPEAFRGKPEDVMVAILTARGLGLDPMVALQRGYVVKGKFDIEVSVKLGLVQSRVPDFSYEVIALDDEKCEVSGGRLGKKPMTTSFTYEQAVAAGLTQGRNGPTPTWQFYRHDMLLNRALGRLLKLTCADALYNMPISMDDSEDAELTAQPDGRDKAPPGPERSGAVVVEGSAEPNPVATPTPPTVVAEPAPVDWLGKMLETIATHYKLPQPPAHRNGRGKWAKAHMEKILRIINLFYGEHNENSVPMLVAVPPMDYERIAVWLMQREAKRAGKEGPRDPSGVRDGAPAQTQDRDNAGPREPAGGRDMEPLSLSVPSLPPEDEPTPEPSPERPASSGWQLLVERGPLNLVTVLKNLAHATKGEREFVEKSAKSGRFALKDDLILKECGFVNSHGTSVSQWLDKLAEGIVWDGVAFGAPNTSAWPMACRAVYNTALALRVSIE